MRLIQSIARRPYPESTNKLSFQTAYPGLSAAVLIFFLTACGLQPSPPLDTRAARSTPSTSTVSKPQAGKTDSATVANSTPEKTSVFVSGIVETITPTNNPPTPTKLPTEISAEIAPTSLPLNLKFPTPQNNVSDMLRPALFPIPWALTPTDHFYFSRPTAANQVYWPLANYRYGGGFPGMPDVIHTGIDIDTPKGTPILAAASGVVQWSGYGLYAGKFDSRDPYGLAVTILHDFGFKEGRLYTIYAHMDKTNVELGQRVEVGDVIGFVGQTGLTTGPHLHFEVRWKENHFVNSLNPELWLVPPQGWGVLAARVMNSNGSFLNNTDVTIQNKTSRRVWIVSTYGLKYVNSDPYYQENLVLSDLPAGDYKVFLDYTDQRYTASVTIRPGAVTYFSFKGLYGFSKVPPPEPRDPRWPNITTPQP